MSRSAINHRGARTEQPIRNAVSEAHGLIDRAGLLAKLDQAVAKKITILSAPPGSGKTSLLRTWAKRTAHRVACVSVQRDEQDPQRFWLTLLDATSPSMSGLPARYPSSSRWKSTTSE